MHNIGEQMSKASVFLSTPLLHGEHDAWPGDVPGTPGIDEMEAEATGKN